jgi:hypothetical protein
MAFLDNQEDKACVADNVFSVNRRKVLQMIAATMFASPLSAATIGNTGTLNRGYGSDPDLLNPVVTWGKYLSKKHLQMLSTLGDFILPEDRFSPKASDLDIVDFVNEWLSAPYEEQVNDRELVLKGLEYLDARASRESNRLFKDISNQQQYKMFVELADAERLADGEEYLGEFFNKLVRLFVGGFYTTEEGMKDIGYIGNVPLTKFAVEDFVLEKLGFKALSLSLVV